MSFSDDVMKFVRQTKERMDAVFRTSASYLLEEITDRTPVKDGFLRASITVQLNAPVYMDGTPGAGTEAINLASATDVIHIGFTMKYAKRIEYGFTGLDSLGRYYNQTGAGMVRLSAQNWPLHVKKAALKAIAEVNR